MRYVVVGPGAVGGTIAGRLAQHGHEVTLVARGAHAAAIRERGLDLRDPDGSVTLRLPVAGSVDELELEPDQILINAVKTQDAGAVLEQLSRVAGPALPIVCAQNGVEAERLALRHFERVYGMCVMLPAAHLEPGVVVASSAPVAGILDVGRYPSGIDDLVVAIAADLDQSGFSSVATHAIMRRKYSKLLMNLGNAIDAACGPGARGSELYRMARLEALACFVEAGIDVASEDEDRQRRGDLLHVRPVDGERRGGGSSWQSLARSTGRIESDYLNGEVVLLGRLHGVPTPVNAMLQRVANELASAGVPPGSLPIEALEHRLTDPDGTGPLVDTS